MRFVYFVLLAFLSSFYSFSQLGGDSYGRSQLKCIPTRDYPMPANFHPGSMNNGHFTYQEVLNELDEMHNLYPNLITEKQNIHDFLTEGEPNNTTNPPIGGNAIKWVKISDNPTLSENEPQVLYLSLSHAREAISLTQNIYYMWYLLENYSTSEEVKNILDNTESYFFALPEFTCRSWSGNKA